MFLLVLRLLAVYFGTAAVALWLAHRFVSQLRLRVALFLTFAPFLLVGKALVTAGVYAPIDIAYQAPPLSALADRMGTRVTQTPALSDITTQMIPWRKAVREAVKNGRLPLWNRFVLAGEPLMAVQQPAVLHPATWIGFLLPLAQAWTFEMALRYFAALLFAYLFMRDLQCGEIAALLAGVAWAFCDFLVFFHGHPHSAAVVPFPLLLLGLSRLVRDADHRAVVLTVVALLLILTAGHPETLVHAVAGAGIFFLFALGFAGRGRRGRPILLSLVAGVLALGLSAVLLLPLADVLPHTWEHQLRTGWFSHIRKSFPIRESLRHGVLNAMPYAFGVSGKGEVITGFGEPSSYAGSVLWPLAVLGLWSPRREKWVIATIGLLGVSVGVRLLGITDAISALPLFDIALNDRMIFLSAFAIAALAALGLERLAQEGGTHLLAGIALIAAAALAVFYARSDPATLQMPSGYFRYRFLLQIAPLLLCAALCLFSHRRRLIGPGAGAVLLLLIAQRYLEERDFWPTYSSRAFYPPLQSLEAIPRRAAERMTALGFTFVPNIAALYEVEDVRGYEAMTFKPLFDTYPLWCVYQPIWFNRVDDLTTPFLSFLNVRYVLTRPDVAPPKGWRVLFEGEEGVLVENPRSLPRVFVPRSVFYEAAAGRRLELLRTIEDFSDRGVVGQAPPSGVSSGDAQPNGQASVRMASYLPDRITLETEVIAPAVVATSVTAWPGWKLTVDGEKARFLSYNHAFLGFRLPAGRHHVVMRYLPDSFVAGSAISAATLLLCVFFFFRRRSRRMGIGLPPRNRASFPPIGGDESKTPERDSREPRRTSFWGLPGATALLAAAAGFACLGYVYKIDRYPTSVDFDSATLGIFVNNLSFHHQYDYSFASSPDVQDQYRRYWAAAALPMTLPLSWLQRMFRVPPEDVGLLIRAAAAGIGLLGACLAAYSFRYAGDWGLRDGLVVLALTSVFPPFLLNIRTGFPNHLLPFLLFWAAIVLTLGYCRTLHPARLYALAFVAAFCLLNPYPPLVVLPLLVFGLLVWQLGLSRLIRTPGCYVAAIVTVLLYLSAKIGLARSAGVALSEYRGLVAAFQQFRGGLPTLERLKMAEMPSRLAVLGDQQILFGQHPDVIRFGRPEHLWALGSLHATWLIVAALAVLGGVVGIWTRRRTAVVALTILAVTTLVVTSFVVPENRYVLVVAPCYGVLAVCALKTFRLSPSTRTCLGAAIIMAMSLNTYILIAREYTPRLDRSWPQTDGIGELARFLHGRWEEGVWYASLPIDKTYQANLYFRMVTNNNAQWLTESEFARKLEAADSAGQRGDRFLMVLPLGDTRAIGAWTARNFKVLGRLETLTAGPLVLLGRGPIAPAQRLGDPRGYSAAVLSDSLPPPAGSRAVFLKYSAPCVRTAHGFRLPSAGLGIGFEESCEKTDERETANEASIETCGDHHRDDGSGLSGLPEQGDPGGRWECGGSPSADGGPSSAFRSARYASRGLDGGEQILGHGLGTG